MVELSPAAQVVFDAYRLASDGHYRDGEWIQDNAGQVAAALLAVADQIEHYWDGTECIDHLRASTTALERFSDRIIIRAASHDEASALWHRAVAQYVQLALIPGRRWRAEIGFWSLSR